MAEIGFPVEDGPIGMTASEHPRSREYSWLMRAMINDPGLFFRKNDPASYCFLHKSLNKLNPASP